jgi:hypothetical protein
MQNEHHNVSSPGQRVVQVVMLVPSRKQEATETSPNGHGIIEVPGVHIAPCVQLILRRAAQVNNTTLG